VRVVIGVGNEWGRDDAAGLEVARRLRGAAALDVRIDEHEGEPAGLIDAWSGAQEAIVVDAVSSGADPGAIHRLDAGRAPLPANRFRASTHALGVADAVELARSLDRLPARLVVYGIEGERFDAGSGLTPAVERAVEVLADRLRQHLGSPAAPQP
jgi:hydrogenase maturation protease